MKKKGVVYTPDYWAEWAVKHYGIAERWMKGAVILDPGCGRGALSSALIREALCEGYKPDPEDMSRIHCIDRDEQAISVFKESLPGLSGMLSPDISFTLGDYLLESPKIKADIIFSNPPWVSFGDLDEKDKENYKPLFRSSGLTPKAKKLILGGSRIDLAALFVVTALNRDTGANGEGYFFLPSSLFRSEAAHSAFRQMKLPGGRSFSLVEIRDMEGGEPFPGAGTGYCLAAYKADRSQNWPIPWFKAGSRKSWVEMIAEPADGPDSPLLPRPAGSERITPPLIQVPQGTLPRQGVNTQGASSVFHITEIEEKSNGMLSVIAKNGSEGMLPAELVYPMMSVSSFSGTEEPIPDRWIFIPHNKKNGKVLTAEELKSYPEAMEWIDRHKNVLENRKGMILNQVMKRGIYWALIGVGPYSFAPWKLAWESYGRKHFIPRLFNAENSVHWQGNQALHAYLPFYNKESAMKAFKDFISPELNVYLKLLGGAGTKNWAQPGRIRRLLISEIQ